ncbi:hypothetical protein KUCAC02_026183 [Chaenocephalus aceratus]|uniref:Uncharacterized protein n=1 Tax=Chaenocephalus aceratus TaxID=36190 RepID=A0ACB9VW06_CHAAC|nr:hypothetical protein KUCAC02_026183 [Chaenocephalus aceratus]
MQKKVLATSLVDLHKEYNQTCEAHHAISYRQFVRYKPFFVTEARSNDRNTCACYQHENMRLRIDSLSQRAVYPIPGGSSKRAHGKGAPDGVGGAVKRMADNHVHGGKDLQNPKDLYAFLINREVENIRFKWIDESDINVFNEMLSPSVPKVPGLLKTHQILSFCPGEIYYRDLSCFCQYPEMCECFKPTKMRVDDSSNANSDHLQPDSIQETYAESPSTDVEKNEEYTVGTFVIVSYDNKLFVGQITKLLLDNIEINCMVQHGKRNVSKWPNKPDCIFYHREQIASVISEPEPNQCAAQLTKYDWLLFNEI